MKPLLLALMLWLLCPPPGMADGSCTVHWSVDGQIVRTDAGAVAGLPLVPPDVPIPADLDRVLAGWTTTATVSPLSAPHYAALIGADVTYYAVFATEKSAYTLVISAPDDWTGQYLIAASDTLFANGSQGGTNHLGKKKNHVNPAQHLSADHTHVDALWGDAYAVSIERYEDVEGFYLLRTQDGLYNYHTSGTSSGLASTANRSTAAKYGLMPEFRNTHDIRLSLSGKAEGAVLSYNPTGYFRFYPSDSQEPVYLYRRQTTLTDFSTDLHYPPSSITGPAARPNRLAAPCDLLGLPLPPSYHGIYIQGGRKHIR
ncbi:MAG: hypothetical protein MJZ43_00035 [Bacteroidaceae bacterium]|nr:hypothetical protein [Bacteroidaceae bacterium]